MLGACHDWAMANLQVKNLPDSESLGRTFVWAG